MAFQPQEIDLDQYLSDLQGQIDALSNTAGFNEQSLRRLQNYNPNSSPNSLGGTTSTSTTAVPPATKSGISIPFVSNVRASVLSSALVSNLLLVQWTNADDPLGIIESYNLWIRSSARPQELLAGGAHLSPAIFSVSNQPAVPTTIIVQTVLKNGHSNSLTDCPTASVLLV